MPGRSFSRLLSTISVVRTVHQSYDYNCVFHRPPTLTCVVIHSLKKWLLLLVAGKRVFFCFTINLYALSGGRRARGLMGSNDELKLNA